MGLLVGLLVEGQTPLCMACLGSLRPVPRELGRTSGTPQNPSIAVGLEGSLAVAMADTAQIALPPDLRLGLVWLVSGRHSLHKQDSSLGCHIVTGQTCCRTLQPPNLSELHVQLQL